MIFLKFRISLFIILYISFYMPFISNAQDIRKAEKVIKQLCSKEFSGRGYVDAGDSLAAQFIANEFKKAGLKTVNGRYFQALSFPVNSFPGKMEMTLGRKKLEAGKDFLIHSKSKGLKGTYAISIVDKNTANDFSKLMSFVSADHTGKFVLFNQEGMSNDSIAKILKDGVLKINGISGIIWVKKDKLTWSVSKEVDDIPQFDILSSSLPGQLDSVFIDAENILMPQHKTQNVIGMIQGTVYPDSFLVFSAHYDHLGKMGRNTYFPGANDNASGTSMLISLASHYAKPKNQPKCSMLFIAFAGEEAGLMGSGHYVENPVLPLSSIRFLINMDIVGTGDEGITVVNGTEHETEFNRLVKINGDKKYLSDIKIRGKAANSDHYMFSEKGVPCFFIYTLGGIKAYHDVFDRPETLPLTEYEDLFRLIRDFSDSLF